MFKIQRILSRAVCLGGVRMSGLFSAIISSKNPHRTLECCSRLCDNMTMATENAQLFGEKYDHLNGADT